MLLQPGTWVAEAKSAVIWESEKGALMITFDFTILNEGYQHETIKGQQCIVQKDGTISEITIRTLKECFGWAGQDPFDLESPEMLAGKQVELVIDFEEYDGKKTIRVKYINALGGGMPKPADRKSVLAKYGAKFRALSGGVPAKAQAPKPLAISLPKPPPSAPIAPAKPSVTPSDMNSAWAQCCEANANVPEETLYNIWNQTIESVAPGKGNDLTPEQWGQVKAKLEDNIPY